MTWALSLGCLIGVVLLLLLAPEPLQNWWDETFQGKIVRGIPHLPLLLLAVVAFWGSNLRQDRVTLLALLLVGTHAQLTLPFLHEPAPGAVREGLAVFLPWAFPLLLSWPEASLKSIWGWGRIAAALSIWVGAFIWAWNNGFEPFWPTFLDSLPGGVRGLSALLALLALWTLPVTEGRDLRLSWTGSLISLGLASLHGEPLWPEPVSGAPWPVFLFFSALFLLGGLYGVTWRRAYLDELTGIPARRAFEETLCRLGRRYSIAMVDVDHFKRFNDRYGHRVGDQVLRFIATRLEQARVGHTFRYGGEEFAIIMPGRRIHQAVPLLEGLRKAIELAKFTIRGDDRPLRKPTRKARPSGGREQVTITVSIGVAARGPHHPGTEDVVNAADEALYAAKEAGRNRVEHDGKRKGRDDIAKRIKLSPSALEKKNNG